MLMAHCNTNERCLLSTRLCCSQEVLRRVPYPARKDTGNLQWHLLTVMQNCCRLLPVHHSQAASHPSVLFSISLWDRLECLPACDRTSTPLLSKLGTTGEVNSPYLVPLSPVLSLFISQFALSANDGKQNRPMNSLSSFLFYSNNSFSSHG